MKKNLLGHLTLPVRSPLHSSPLFSQRIEDDTSSVGAPKSRSKPTISLCPTDRWPGPAVIHVALLVIFHSYPM
jgi:hypothetical protein